MQSIMKNSKTGEYRIKSQDNPFVFLTVFRGLAVYLT